MKNEKKLNWRKGFKPLMSNVKQVKPEEFDEKYVYLFQTSNE